jgi:dihydroorotate dehydrogenase
MLDRVFGLAQPLLFAFEPETAHEMSLKALEAGIYPRASGVDDPRLKQRIFDLDFANPIGIAAGYDKDARVPDAVLGIGCGFAEVGTVTPKPQGGNPQPRVFRLISDRALINRLGFNNGGHTAALARLETRAHKGGIVVVNIGANKDTDDKAADYELGLETFNRVASAFTVNISSPNTPGLRDLQAPAALDALLTRLTAARAALIGNGGPKRPIIVKIAPDIVEADLPAIVDRLQAHAVDGIAVSNTTLARTGLTAQTAQTAAGEAGGLSGKPLFHRSTVMLARVYRLTDGKIPLIGIGGIDSGAAAIAKIEAGASLIQLYTGLVYEGPALINRIKRDLTATLERERLLSISALVGRRAEAWAARTLT